MKADAEQERQRVQEFVQQIGHGEYNRRLALYEEAQQLCYTLCVLTKRTPRIESLLLKAEARRERRARYAWGY